MAFRDDLGAAQARSEALERRVAELEAENQELRGEPLRREPDPEPAPRTPGVFPLFVIAALLAAAAAAAVFAGQPVVAAVSGAIALLLCLQTIMLRSLLHLAGPNTALVVSGRQRRASDGTTRGYRVVVGGRVVVMPLLETVERLDLRPHPVEVKASSVYTKDNVAVSIAASADVHMARSEPLIDNAVERFLGRPISDMARVAAETLEGHVRAVLAASSYDEIASDLDRLAEELIAESGADMDKLGLVVDRLAVSEIERSPGD